MTQDAVLSIGLTGGIGSGKSAASTALAQRGAIIVDADKIAREVVEPGTPGLAAVIERFGERLLTDDGALDRPALAEIVFADRSALADLNAIVHPLVHVRREELFAAARPGDVVINDIPLLAEGDGAPSFHLVLVVHAPLPTRLERLMKHRGVPESDARARIEAQATDEQRAAIADVVLDNSGSLEALGEQIDRVWTDRLAPYAANLAAGRHAEPVPPAEAAARPRIEARLERATGWDVVPTGNADRIVLRPSQATQPVVALASAGWFAGSAENPAEAWRSADPGCGHVVVIDRNSDR